MPVFPVTWLQSPKRGPTFNAPESYFTFGNPDTGKSNQNIAIMTNFLSNGHKGIDAWGSESGAEELGWFFSPYKDKTIMIHGDDVEVDTHFAKMPISKFSLDALKDYDMAVTTRELYGAGQEGEYSHYGALAKVFNLCKTRKGWKSSGGGQVIVLMVREAWNVIYSQMRAGLSKDEQAAQMELKRLDKQRFHTGIAPLLDSQRYMDIDTSVRQLTNFRIIKGFGGQVIPDEFDFLFKPHLFGNTPWRLRNLPRDEFIMVTSWNGVATGLVDKVPWNVHKGQDLVDLLGIIVHPPKVDEEKSEQQRRAEQPLPKREAPLPEERAREHHRRTMELHNQGRNYVQIAEELTKAGMPITYHTARLHVRGDCTCEK